MRCPQCDFENLDTSIFCEECGSLINPTEYTLEQNAYNAPPPPPLNGHQVLSPPLPPPPAYPPFEAQSQLLVEQKIISRPGIGILSGILYFIGLLIAATGVIGTIVNVGTSTPISGIALLSGIVLIIAGIIFFIRIRKRFTILRWWQRILWIAGATVGAFIILAIGISFLQNTDASNILTGCMIFLYGLVWAAIAVW